MPVAKILVTTVVTFAVSSAYAMYTTREGRREDREFAKTMKTRINDIAQY